jgi:hypothetical protein
MGGVGVGIWQGVKHQPGSAVAAAPAAAADQRVLLFSVDMQVPTDTADGSSCSSLISKEANGTTRDAGGPVVSLLLVVSAISFWWHRCIQLNQIKRTL